MLNSILQWFSNTRFWVWFSSKVISGYNLRRWGYTQFPMKAFFEIFEAINESEKAAPGIYAFSCVDRGSFAGWLITTFVGTDTAHAGVFYPESLHSEKLMTVFHMKGKGWCEDHFLDLLKEVDSCIISKYEFTSVEERDRVASKLKEIRKAGPTYDFQQELESKSKIYCSELVYAIMKDVLYKDRDGGTRVVRPGRDLGRSTFDPDDVYKQATKILWENL